MKKVFKKMKSIVAVSLLATLCFTTFAPIVSAADPDGSAVVRADDTPWVDGSGVAHRNLEAQDVFKAVCLLVDILIYGPPQQANSDAGNSAKPDRWDTDEDQMLRTTD